MSKNVKEATSTTTKKNAFLEALRKSLGVISTACEAAGISRQTFYNWKRDDEDFSQEVEDISETAVDFAESKLLEKINGVTMGKIVDGQKVIYETAPSDTAIIFFLKTRGKSRGYIERQEITGKDGSDLYGNMTDEELDRELDKIGQD